MWKLLTTLTSIAYLFTYVRLCTENGIIKGMFGREQLIPCPDHDAKSIGINYKALDKSKVITMTEAGEMYSRLGGKLSFCRCRSDCSKSIVCKCWKLKKICGQFCHGGSGKNSLCRNCAPQMRVQPPPNNVPLRQPAVNYGTAALAKANAPQRE